MKQNGFLILLLFFCFAAKASGENNTLVKDSGYVNISEGGRLYYEAYGKGEPVILVHGHSLDRRMWRTQIPALAKEYRVYTPDMRGYGRSSRQREDLHTTHVDDLIAFMDSLHIEKAHVIGLSMGGFISADMVAMYPERMLSCVMASGTLRSVKGPSEPVDSAEYANMETEIKKHLEIGIGKWRHDWINGLVVKGGSKSENIRAELTEIIEDWDAWQLVNHEPRLYYAREALPVLKERCPKVPTLYIGGEKENKKRPGILNYLPNSEFVVLPDCGHMSNMEQPEIFNKTILDFLHKQ